MGATYEFKCEKCTYHIQVSGGKDSGKCIDTATRVCPNCRRVVDVVTAVYDPAQGKRVKAPPDAYGRCPRCGNFKTLPWKPRLCPKCGGKMKKTGDGPVCMWD